MAVTFAFVGSFLLSLVVALLAALQLSDFFGTGDEFVLIILTLAIFSAISITVFVVTYAAAKRAQAINWAAFALAAASFAPVFSPRLVALIAERSTNPFTVGSEETAITLELVVPALVMVLVQWGLVRRRWLRQAGEEDLTLWPWVTTAIAGLVILNPLGLDVVAAALRHSGTDWLWRLWATITAAIAAILVVMASIECYTRGRILRRRLQAPAP